MKINTEDRDQKCRFHSNEFKIAEMSASKLTSASFDDKSATFQLKYSKNKTEDQILRTKS